MAVTVTLYKTTSLPNVVDKVLGTAVSTYSNAKFLEPYDEYMPVIRIRGKISFDDCNYLSISGNGDTKYYFIEGVEVKSPAICHVKCRLDVLKTYSTFIKSLTCYLERTADPTFGSPYLVDKRPLYPMNEVEKKTFRDANDNVEGFVIPGETKDHQKGNGYYVLTVIQTGYDVTPSSWPSGYHPVQPSS